MKKLLVLLVNIFLSYILFSKNVVINGTILNIEIAESSSERAKGLMNRDFLEEDSGMLFIWPEVSQKCMWMKNTKIPLSIAFVDQNFLVREIKNLRPMNTDSICSNSKSIKYALEVNEGWFRKNNIKVFHRLEIN